MVAWPLLQGCWAPTCEAEQSQVSSGFLSSQECGEGYGKQNTHFKDPVDSTTLTSEILELFVEGLHDG